MVTRAELKQIVEVIKNRGADISLDWPYGKPQAFSANGSKGLSPQLSASQMKVWLLAYLEGYDSGWNAGYKEAEWEPKLTVKQP